MLSLLFSFSPVHSLMLAADVSLRRTCAGSSRKLRPSRSTTSACRSASYLHADTGLMAFNLMPCCQNSPKCTNIHHSVLICTTVYQYSAECTNVHHCVPIFTRLYQCSPQCISFHHGVSVFTTVYQFSPRCISFHHGVSVLTTVYHHSPQLPGAHQNAYLMCLTMPKLQMTGWTHRIDTMP